MRNTTWIKAYENFNVDVGFPCGLPGRAHAAPDKVADILAEKITHPWRAQTTWALRLRQQRCMRSKYRQVDVAARQQELRGRRPPSLTALLTMPFARSWILHRRRREAKRPARRPIWVQVKPRRSANRSGPQWQDHQCGLTPTNTAGNEPVRN